MLIRMLGEPLAGGVDVVRQQLAQRRWSVEATELSRSIQLVANVLKPEHFTIRGVEKRCTIGEDCSPVVAQCLVICRRHVRIVLFRGATNCTGSCRSPCPLSWLNPYASTDLRRADPARGQRPTIFFAFGLVQCVASQGEPRPLALLISGDVFGRPDLRIVMNAIDALLSVVRIRRPDAALGVKG